MARFSGPMERGLMYFEVEPFIDSWEPYPEVTTITIPLDGLADRIARTIFDTVEAKRGMPPAGDTSWAAINGAVTGTRAFRDQGDAVVALLQSLAVQ